MQTVQEAFEIPEHRRHSKKLKKQEPLAIMNINSEPLKYTKKRICNDSSEEDDRFPLK